jgi:hypothetical protein
MASAVVLNPLGTWQGHPAHGSPTARTSTRATGWDERSGRLLEKALLDSKLNLIAHTWVELCASLKVSSDGPYIEHIIF